MAAKRNEPAADPASLATVSIDAVRFVRLTCDRVVGGIRRNVGDLIMDDGQLLDGVLARDVRTLLRAKKAAAYTSREGGDELTVEMVDKS